MSTALAICLCSGGLDSSVALAATLRHGLRCKGLFVDYGQVARHAEQVSFRSVCARLGVDPIERELRLWSDKDGSSLLGGGEGPFLRHRNLALLLLADLIAIEEQAGTVVAGFCVAPSYPDSSRAFVSLAASTLALSVPGDRTLLTPLIELDKRAIGRLAAELDFSIGLTRSCHGADPTPCQNCAGCRDRLVAEEAFHAARLAG